MAAAALSPAAASPAFGDGIESCRRQRDCGTDADYPLASLMCQG